MYQNEFGICKGCGFHHVFCKCPKGGFVDSQTRRVMDKPEVIVGRPDTYTQVILEMLNTKDGGTFHITGFFEDAGGFISDGIEMHLSDFKIKGWKYIKDITGWNTFAKPSLNKDEIAKLVANNKQSLTRRVAKEKLEAAIKGGGNLTLNKKNTDD